MRGMPGLVPPLHDRLLAAIAVDGYAFVRAAQMQPALERLAPLSDWDAFAASWDDLELDRHMADHGRYRRRRHAIYSVRRDGDICREAHQPHYQSRAYNPLNGGVERWFEPVAESIGSGASMHAILTFCRYLFTALAPAIAAWRIEVHQFRIEARAGESGLPTPEGVHRDGVDYVLVLLIRRHNIASGTTTVHAPDRHELGSFTLTGPCDAALLDDHRVFHGVTPVEPLDAAAPAWRDVLVVTFRAT
jgi:hypothetical protein